MTRLRVFLSRVGGVFLSRRRERELDEEVRHHLEMLADRYMQDGWSADQAWKAARREFGRVDSMKELYRKQRGLPLVEVVLQDLKYGVRTLRKAPVFTLAALVSLTLGIGANSAIFSVVNGVLLRPLPYPDAHRLVQVLRTFPSGGIGSSLDGSLAAAVQEHARMLEAVAVTGPNTGLNLAQGTSAEFVRALPVSREYFEVLGVTPRLGRAFLPEEVVPNGPNVAIVSDDVWRRLLNADPDAIGRTITASHTPYTVVGVMPPDFHSIPPVDVWYPLGEMARGSYNYTTIARLAPGATIPSATAELVAAVDGVRDALTQSFGDGQSLAAVEYGDFLARSDRRPLLILWGVVGAVLLIACANVANLLLARAVSRGREMSIRWALGAGRRRVALQLLTEGLLLSVIAGVCGLLVARLAAPALLSMSPAGAASWRSVPIDATVVVVTAVISVATGVVFGLAPIATLDPRNLGTRLRDDGARTTQGMGTSWLRRSLVAGEVALSVVLLAGAGLLIRSFVNLRSVDLGFDPSGVMTAQMSLNSERYRDPETVRAFYQRGLERVTSLPEVEAAAVVSGLPVERGLNVVVDVPDAAEPIDNALVDLRYVSAEYFDLMRIPVLAGRSFDDRDAAGAPPVVVVNREFARRLFADDRAIGRHAQIFSRGTEYEIVGVVGNVEEQGIGGNDIAVMYIHMPQAARGTLSSTHYYYPVSWVVRTRSGAADVAGRIREAIRAVDPLQPFTAFRSMDEVVAQALSTARFHMVLLSLFSGLAVILASAGIYGLMTYVVSARAREIGVRIALGASAAAIVRTVVGQGVALASAGVVVGLLGAAALTRLLDAFVFGVSTADPTSFAIAALGLLVVAVLASAIPAWRAARVDPVRMLRTE